MTALGDLIEEIDLEEFLDSLEIDYRRTSGGDNLNLRSCPFCRSDEYRAYMSIEKKLGTCFAGSCGKAWNLFSFTRAHLECSSAATMRHLEGYAGASLSPTRGTRLPRAVHVPSADWALPDSVPIPTSEGMTHPYLLDRGVLPATQALFGLRWCEAGVYRYEDMTGVAKTMRFDQRIILPICDLDGTLTTFVGRDVTGTADIRYQFAPLLPSGGRHLYGGERLAGHPHVAIGEGPFDAMAIHQAIDGHPDFRGVAATASFGISLGHADPTGDDQLGRLLRLKATGLTRVTMVWDGERKAMLAALKAAEVIARHGLAVHIALLPEDSDPAEVETRVVRRAIAEALPYTPLLRVQLELQGPYRT